jgi:hypothetical protein
MANKERYQNPAVGDTVTLRLFFYNSNNLTNVSSINQIKLFKVADGASMNDASAKTLVATIPGASVPAPDGTGRYYVDVVLEEGVYTIGNYVDVWDVSFENSIDSSSSITNIFQVYPDLWYTTPIPVVYDFNFNFRPARLRQGSKRYLIIEVTPNVPKGTDLQRYYENLAILGDLKISIEQRTGECLPQEQDLRLIVDKVNVDYREKQFGYYMLDTTEYDVGIYDIWFELDLGENVYISERNQLQIFE